MEFILIILVSISLLLNLCIMFYFWWQLRSGSTLDKYIKSRFNVYYIDKKIEETEIEEGGEDDDF